MTGFAWTDEQIADLKRMWAEGASASEIASEFSSVSRNAVLGKVYRLGLSKRKKPSRPRLPPPEPRAPQKLLAARAKETDDGIEIDGFNGAPALEDQAIPVEQRRSLLGPPCSAYPERRSGECAWPVGDPREDPADFFFCGAPSYGGLPYCAHHARRAYTVPERRPRAQEPFRRSA